MALDTPEQIELFKEMYLNSECTIDEIAKEFNLATGSIYRRGFELGLKRPRKGGVGQLSLREIRAYCERISSNLPPLPVTVKERAYLPSRHEIDAILLLSDLHFGRVTPTTNGAVLSRRLIALGNRVAERVSNYSNIKQLTIFSLGDIVTGERVGQQVTLEELETTVLNQIYGYAIPRLTTFTERLLRHFTYIRINAVPGNHGVIMKGAVSTGANWDTIVSLGWKAMLRGYKQVEFDISMDKWYLNAAAGGIRWMLIHGEQCRGGQPYNSIAQAIGNWKQSMPEPFDWLALGHFHHINQVRNSLVNGCLVTDDEWSREMIKRDGDCCQLLVLASRGKIHDIIPIWLDDIQEEEEDLRL